MKKLLFLLPWVLAFILTLSCGTGGRKIKPVELQINIQRFEKSLFTVDKYNIAQSIAGLQNQYGSYVQLFTNRIIAVGDPSIEGFEESFGAFLTDLTIYNTYKRVEAVYPDMHHLEEQLSVAFGYYKSYFPDKTVPQVYTHISGFNQSIATDSAIISISLDNYLGKDEAMYNQLYPPLPMYARYLMHKDKIASDVLYAWALTEFEFHPETENLLAEMIYQGRAMYFVKCMLPQMNDTLIWGYTPKQFAFCELNEKDMWTFLIENKLLFNTERFTISKYSEAAPFTKSFGEESPGKAVIWLGYQIIQSYMDKNKGSLATLMSENNYQKLLNLSGYNP